MNNDHLVDLYDTYKELLTEKQKEYFESYYFYDNSLKEIASYYENSRNAIFSQIKKVNKKLEDYENKLKLLNKIKQIENLDIDKKIINLIIDILKE